MSGSGSPSSWSSSEERRTGASEAPLVPLEPELVVRRESETIGSGWESFCGIGCRCEKISEMKLKYNVARHIYSYIYIYI